MKTTLHSIGQSVVRLDRFTKLLCAAALLLVAASTAHASDPIGIYAFVDRVVFEPAEGTPERIQVWGGFTLSKGNTGSDYASAERGYLYFTVRPGDEEVCRKEWADLKSVAGTGQVVAFGSRREKMPTLRKADSKAENPDVYPKGFGVVKVGPGSSTQVDQLIKLHDAKAEPKPRAKTSAN